MKVNITWTRVLAIAMSLALLIGSMSAMTVNAATDIGEITLGVNTGIAGDGATVYVTVSQQATVDDNWSTSYVAADDASGMFLNGETKLDGARICFFSWGNAMQFGSVTIEAGQSVTVKGNFAASNADDTFSVKEVVFTWDGKAWTAAAPSATAQSVALTPNNVTGTWTANVLYLSVSPAVAGTLPAYNSFTAVDGTMTVNGETASSSVKMLTSWDGATNSIWYIQNTAGNFADGDIVSISGTWELNGVTVDIAEVSFQWKDSAWAVYVPPVAVTADELVISAVGWSDGASLLQFKLESGTRTGSETMTPAEASGSYAAGSIKVNGTALASPSFTFTDNSTTIMLTGIASAFAEGTTIEISGLFAVSDGTYVNFATPFTAIYSGGAWGKKVDAQAIAIESPSNPTGTWSNNIVYVKVTPSVTGTLSSDAQLSSKGGTITVNGADSSAYFAHGWSNNYFYINGINASEGDVVTISGQFQNGNVLVDVTEVSLKWNGTSTGWTLYTPATSIDVDLSPYGVESSTVMYAAADADTTAIERAAHLYPQDGAYVKLNGTVLTDSANYELHTAGWAESVLYVQMVDGTEFATGDVMEVSGSFATDDGAYVVNVATYTVQYNGTAWSVYVEPTVLAKPVLTLSGTTVSWTAVDGATNYEVYINGSKTADTTATSYSLSALGLGSYTVTVKATGGENTVAAESDAVIYTLAATDVTLSPEGTCNATVVYLHINGATVSDAYLWNTFTRGETASVKLNGKALTNDQAKLLLGYTGGMLYVQLVDDREFAAGDELTVSGIWSLGGVYINVAEVTWLYNGSSWAVPVEPTVTDVTLSDYTFVAPSASLFYVKASTAAAPVAGYKPQGATSGVWYNGTRLSGGSFEIGWTNEDGGTASGAIVRFGQDMSVQVGDKVTVKGEFVNGSDCLQINEVSFWYDGEYWKTTEIVLSKGDLNDDGEIDVCDVVLFAITLEDGTAGNRLGATDMDNDGDADADDVTILRKILLGYHYVDGVVLDKYNAAETVQLFADSGPVPYAGHIGLGDNSGLDAYFGAGFNTFVMTEDYTANNGDDGNTTIYNATTGEVDADYAAAIKLAQQYGDVMVRGYNSATYFDNNLYAKLYDLGVRKFYLWDEPTSSQLSELAGMLTAFNEQLPSDVLMHVNLLPSYGEKGIESGDNWWDSIFGTGTTYEDYVDAYVSDVMSKVDAKHTLSVDNYPLMNSGSGNYLRESYLKDLWVIANRAKTNDPSAIVNYCIQAFDYKDTELRTPASLADIRFQTNTGLALGAESFEYFLYYTWSNDTDITGLVNNGLYDVVKQVNTELTAWDSVYLSFDWQGVKAYNVASAMTSGVTQLSTLQDISVSATAATLVGEYKYGSADEYGYMITNFTEPSAGTTDTVTVTMTAGQTALVYVNGVGSWMTADDGGNLTLTLKAGEGAFVIPQ